MGFRTFDVGHFCLRFLCNPRQKKVYTFWIACFFQQRSLGETKNVALLISGETKGLRKFFAQQVVEGISGFRRFHYS